MRPKKWKIVRQSIFRAVLRVILRVRAVQLPNPQRPMRKSGAGIRVAQKSGATPVPAPLARHRNPLRRTPSASGVAPGFCAVPRPDSFRAQEDMKFERG